MHLYTWSPWVVLTVCWKILKYYCKRSCSFPILSEGSGCRTYIKFRVTQPALANYLSLIRGSREGNFTHCGTCYDDETLLIETQLCFQLNKKLKSFSSFTRVMKFVTSKHTRSKSALPNLSSSLLHHLAKISNFWTCSSIKKSYFLLHVTNLVM